ncbi:MAG TPA: class I SAM-dependent methyltransferase [Gemmatimonadales bacterium]|jgi:SAM-dependent methyltransferase|nr:class I SAM-dependent methyltransferase [Gemmatimonadales bacterium]
MSGALARHGRAFARSIRERGFLPSLRIALSTLWCAALDTLDERAYRSNTAGNTPIQLAEIRSENKTHCSPYSTPSQFRLIRKSFKAVMELNGRGFSSSTLVDFGCGKGRVLLVASEFGFKKVVGVEFSPELCREAEANIGTFIERKKKPFDFQVVNADAARFEIPPEADVFYFFAFDGHVLDQVAQNIVLSRQRFPRAIWAIYVKATFGEVFGARGFRVVRELSWCGFPTKIYAL